MYKQILKDCGLYDSADTESSNDSNNNGLKFNTDLEPIAHDQETKPIQDNQIIELDDPFKLYAEWKEDNDKWWDNFEKLGQHSATPGNSRLNEILNRFSSKPISSIKPKYLTTEQKILRGIPPSIDYEDDSLSSSSSCSDTPSTIKQQQDIIVLSSSNETDDDIVYVDTIYKPK